MSARHVRWSDKNSEAGLDLQSLIRHAQAQGPTTAQLESLTQRVLAELPQGISERPGPIPAESPATPGSRAPKPAASVRPWLLWTATALLASLVWVASRHTSPVNSEEELRSRTPSEAQLAKPAMPDALEPPVASIPQPIARSEVEEPAFHRPTKVRVPQARAAERAKPEATEHTGRVAEQPIDEVSLLHRARRLVIAQPEAALALTALHAAQHPGGLFREEREALRIEALWRLRRKEEAQRAFAEFTREFPRSTYRPRLFSQLQE